MPDIAAVRAEIKAWERDFRNNHHRDPSVQDIRDQPAIAEKYKLYKKLSKATAEHAPPPGQSSSHPPSTPPRPQARQSRAGIISKPRAVEPAAPLPGFNPFSPVKDKGKQKGHFQKSASSRARKPTSNPFATPSKNKPKPLTQSRSVSPDPFSQIEPLPTANNSSDHQLPPAPNTAISRARKRLRGEPVSPSPNKQKRQRIGSQTGLPFPRLASPLSSDGGESDEQGETGEHNSSFVVDSPVKAPLGGKSFKRLFEDAILPSGLPRKPSGLTQAQSADTSDIAAFFAEGGAKDHANREAAKQKQKVQTDVTRRNVGLKRDRRAGDIDEKLASNRIFPSKHDVFSVDDSLNGSQSLPSGRTAQADKLVPSHSSQARASTKRALRDEEHASESLSQGFTHTPELTLLPPSPPPNGSSTNHQSKGKGKTAATSRKKAKVAEEEVEEEEDDSPDEFIVKVVNRSHAQQAPENADSLDWDPILNYGAHNHDPHVQHDTDLTGHQETGTFHVDLPDKLRLVLAISSSSHASKEEHVVRGLLHGSRVGHYDASRGGNIWDVGEGGDDARVETEGEDDWEGEPVPWEVGEL
ncbi:hypothetical protein BV22DRAFT_1000481 [Leucogyrophana mollusca]|uniref:Uncharacterized protein n=1 Tax=Leucogyrophana mollusca TaxID=85980 RepID=A0ACB8BZJ8_9AGAM|nr:hypothetical protein BV22DRAFT_1000481 [Leucogyrophana mollusca]